MKCHYCGNDNTKPGLTLNDGTVLTYDCDGEFCKYTSVDLDRKCDDCHKKFTYSYDHFLDGDSYIQICRPCQNKRVKEYLSSPEMIRLLEEEMKKPPPKWLTASKEEQEMWSGASIPIPFKFDK